MAGLISVRYSSPEETFSGCGFIAALFPTTVSSANGDEPSPRASNKSDSISTAFAGASGSAYLLKGGSIIPEPKEAHLLKVE